MINQTCNGIYSWLPLGFRVIAKIENIIAEEQNKIGAHRILMPTIQPAKLWQESGRYDDYGKEMLRIKDRHDREMLYGPTHEEVATDLARQFIKSYKQLPVVLYQIHWKFRDEVRPRFGVMRGREFLMKDGYSFDITREGAVDTYKNVVLSYIRTFARVGLNVIPVRADSGAIGGDLSHEFHVMAQTGESEIFYDNVYDDLAGGDITFADI
jgi:prolyl-tRNA synthetase